MHPCGVRVDRSVDVSDPRTRRGFRPVPWVHARGRNDMTPQHIWTRIDCPHEYRADIVCYMEALPTPEVVTLGDFELASIDALALLTVEQRFDQLVRTARFIAAGRAVLNRSRRG